MEYFQVCINMSGSAFDNFALNHVFIFKLLIIIYERVYTLERGYSKFSDLTYIVHTLHTLFILCTCRKKSAYQKVNES